MEKPIYPEKLLFDVGFGMVAFDSSSFQNENGKSITVNRDMITDFL